MVTSQSNHEHLNVVIAIKSELQTQYNTVWWTTHEYGNGTGDDVLQNWWTIYIFETRICCCFFFLFLFERTRCERKFLYLQLQRYYLLAKIIYAYWCVLWSVCENVSESMCGFSFSTDFPKSIRFNPICVYFVVRELLIHLPYDVWIIFVVNTWFFVIFFSIS